MNYDIIKSTCSGDAQAWKRHRMIVNYSSHRPQKTCTNPLFRWLCLLWQPMCADVEFHVSRQQMEGALRPDG